MAERLIEFAVAFFFFFFLLFMGKCLHNIPDDHRLMSVSDVVLLTSIIPKDLPF